MPEAATRRLQTSRRPQLPRSRNGCLTCKRRKVRCNEEKPVCGHCSRLRLECHWKNADAATPTGDTVRFHQSMNHTSTVTMSQRMEQPQQTPFADPLGFSGYAMDPLADLFAFREPSIQGSAGFDAAQADSMLMDAATASVSSNASDVDDTALQMTVPPILEPVENGPNWAVSSRDVPENGSIVHDGPFGRRSLCGDSVAEVSGSRRCRLPALVRSRCDRAVS